MGGQLKIVYDAYGNVRGVFSSIDDMPSEFAAVEGGHRYYHIEDVTLNQAIDRKENTNLSQEG